MTPSDAPTTPVERAPLYTAFTFLSKTLQVSVKLVKFVKLDKFLILHNY